jgi:hypothetical protein
MTWARGGVPSPEWQSHTRHVAQLITPALNAETRASTNTFHFQHFGESFTSEHFAHVRHYGWVNGNDYYEERFDRAELEAAGAGAYVQHVFWLLDSKEVDGERWTVIFTEQGYFLWCGDTLCLLYVGVKVYDIMWYMERRGVSGILRALRPQSENVFVFERKITSY